jgi:nucleoside-diphosphate-sugar epimerase
MRVAVTGGTGFIGRRVVRALRERGHEVVCVVRRPEKANELSALGATLVQGDILDRQSLDRAFAGCEGVMHLAASYEVGVVGKRADAALAQNLDGTRNALFAARDASATRIVYTSSIVAFGNTGGVVFTEANLPARAAHPHPHPTRYSLSKARAHLEVVEPLMKAGVPIIAVMPGAVLGPRDHSNFHLVFKFMADGLPVPVGRSAYTVVRLDDCVAGHLLALERGVPGQSYLLTNENLLLHEFASRAAAASGVPAKVVLLPDWLLEFNARLFWLLERLLPVPSWLSSEAARSMLSTQTMIFDSARARRELGWSPQPIDEALKEIMADELSLRGKPLPPLLEGVTPRL